MLENSDLKILEIVICRILKRHFFAGPEKEATGEILKAVKIFNEMKKEERKIQKAEEKKKAKMNQLKNQSLF